MKNKICYLILNIFSIILMTCSLQMGTIGPGGNRPSTVFEYDLILTVFNLILIFINLFNNYLVFANNRCFVENGNVKKKAKITFYILNILSIILIIVGYCVAF